MRKRIVGRTVDQPRAESQGNWLDLAQIATVEVTSEDPAFPIESALAGDNGRGWRASEPGEQQVRIIFDEPVPLRLLELRFEETETPRTQEFVLRWFPATGGAAKEIVRQQWNFSPTGSTTEVERYAVDLDAVAVLELAIRPDVGGRPSVASLAAWRLK